MWRVDKTCGGLKFYDDIYFCTVSIKRTVSQKHIDNICPIAVKILQKFLSECYSNPGVAPQDKFWWKTLSKIKFSMYIAENVEAGINVEGGILAKNVEAGINVEGGKFLQKE